MFGATPLPSTDEEKVVFVFTRYDKDGDSTWKQNEAAMFAQEILGESLSDFAAMCAEWGCGAEGPKLEHLTKRYADNSSMLEEGGVFSL